MFQLMRLVALMVVVIVGVLGCGFEGISSGEQPRGFVPPPPSPEFLHIQGIPERSKKAAEMAEKALKIDGTNEAVLAARIILNCVSPVDICANNVGVVEASSKVGAWAGLAMNLARRVQPGMGRDVLIAAENTVVLAEKFAKKAFDSAQGAADARQAAVEKREAEEAKLTAEKQSIAEAATICDANASECKTKCNAGEGPFCVSLASKLLQAGKATEARPIFLRACRAGTLTACVFLKKMEADAEARAQQVDALWEEVQRIGDDIAQRKHMASFARKYANNRPGRAGAARIDAHVAALITEQYCPAKKAYLAQKSVVDFQKRAGVHCKEAPPMGQGVTGVEVALGAECSEVYATPCP